jgi:hypothetical protein
MQLYLFYFLFLHYMFRLHALILINVNLVQQDATIQDVLMLHLIKLFPLLLILLPSVDSMTTSLVSFLTTVSFTSKFWQARDSIQKQS